MAHLTGATFNHKDKILLEEYDSQNSKHQQYLSSLLFWKANEESVDLKADEILYIHSRGPGLLKVTKKVLNIYTVADAHKKAPLIKFDRHVIASTLKKDRQWFLM